MQYNLVSILYLWQIMVQKISKMQQIIMNNHTPADQSVALSLCKTEFPGKNNWSIIAITIKFVPICACNPKRLVIIMCALSLVC